LGKKETEINTKRRLWDETSQTVVRIIDKINGIEEENDNMTDEINRIKLKRSQGDDSLATENMMKELENQIEGKNEIIRQERSNLSAINNERAKVENKIEEMGVKAILKSDKPFMEKIKAILKLKGGTIGAVVAAVGLFFSTIGLSISNALKRITAPSTPATPGKPATPPNKSTSITDKVKKELKDLSTIHG
jgi:Fe2+ transport system protein B